MSDTRLTLSKNLCPSSALTDPFGDGRDGTLYLSIEGPNGEDVSSPILQVFYLKRGKTGAQIFSGTLKLCKGTRRQPLHNILLGDEVWDLIQILAKYYERQEYKHGIFISSLLFLLFMKDYILVRGRAGPERISETLGFRYTNTHWTRDQSMTRLH